MDHSDHHTGEGEEEPLKQERASDSDSDEVDINLSENSTDDEDYEIDIEVLEAENTAKIANYITYAAIGAILLLLLYGFALACKSPEDSEAIVKGTVVPYLKAVSEFFSAVFSPLLAFILGYYFSQKSKPSRS